VKQFNAVFSLPQFHRCQTLYLKLVRRSAAFRGRNYGDDKQALGTKRAGPVRPTRLFVDGVTVALATSLLASCGSIQRTYWDARIDEMCQKDGGVTVYERVTITTEEFKSLGGAGRTVRVLRREVAPPNAPYVADNTTAWLNRDPDVFRSETLIVRTSDGKVLSRQVNYVRVRLEFGQPHSCQDVGVRLDVERQTFEIKGG
jgi:hypothetical protein